MNRPSSRRGVLRGLSTLPLLGSGVALSGASTAVADPAAAGSADDAELLALGRQFENLRARYEAAEGELETLEITDARVQSLDDETDDLAMRLQPVMHATARLKANTPAGMRVKLLAFEHCQYAVEEHVDDLIEMGCTNDRLKLSILRDLLDQHGIEQRQLTPPSVATA